MFLYFNSGQCLLTLLFIGPERAHKKCCPQPKIHVMFGLCPAVRWIQGRFLARVKLLLELHSSVIALFNNSK